jgi:hypothetical protein
MLLDVVDERRGSPREWAKNYKAARKRLMNPVKPMPPVKMAPVSWVFDKIRPPLGVAMHIGIEIATYNPITVPRIVRTVAAFYNISPAELVSPRREQKLVDARHVAMHLARVLTSRSLPDIGRRMGDRDHTTILHGIRKVQKVLSDPASPFHADIAEIRAMLEA